jgi:hypothetical protein
MNEQELRDMFHAYRPMTGDNDEFMEKLMVQMDEVDARQQQPRVIPMYRKVLPWVAAIAAAVVAAVLVIKDPDVSPAASSYEPGLPGYDYRVPSHTDFASYEDVVSEIERSGRQLENAIAQL